MGFWDFFWLMIWAFVFISYLMVLFQVVGDIFRDKDLHGVAKTVWLIALFLAPLITALVYVIVRGRGMGQRQQAAVADSRAAAADYVRSVAGTDPATSIANAKALLNDGTITQQEFEALKAKALA